MDPRLTPQLIDKYNEASSRRIDAGLASKREKDGNLHKANADASMETNKSIDDLLVSTSVTD